MGNKAWRPDQDPWERLSRWLQSRLPNSLGGESPNPFGDSVSSADLASLSGATDDGESGVAHFHETLKAVGVAPLPRYNLQYAPVKSPDGVSTKWPLVVAGGVEQVESIDYTCESNVLTILTAMDLQTNELLWCRYDYDDSIPLDTPEEYLVPTIVGTPYIDWRPGGSGGTRVAFFRLEGMDPVLHPNVNTGFEPSFNLGENAGQGTYDQAGGAGNVGIAFHPSGYANNIWTDSLIRPWYGSGEVAPTGLIVIINRENAGGTQIILLANEVQVKINGGDPPTNWQGELLSGATVIPSGGV